MVHFSGLGYIGVLQVFASQVLRVSGSRYFGFLVLGFCGLGLFRPWVFKGLRSFGSGFLGCRIFQSSVPKVLRSWVRLFWDLCFFQSLFPGILGFSTLRHFRVQGLLGQAFWVSGFFNLKVFVPSFVYFRFVGSKIVGVLDWGVLGSSCCRFPSLRFLNPFWVWDFWSLLFF